MIPEAVAVAAAFAHIFAGDRLGPLDPVVKAMPVAILGALVFMKAPRPGRRFAAAGLAVAALADAVIEYSFLGGLATFLVAHLLYIAAFACVEPRLRLWRLLPIAVWAGVALPILVGHAGALALPVLAYGLVIFVMMWRAAATFSSAGWNPATLALTGAVLFGISDTLLGYSRFVTAIPASGLWIMATYWSGQTLIAASFLREA